MSIVELRKKIGSQILSNPEFDGSKESFKNLDPTEQVLITNAMKEYIRKNPNEFTATQKNIAELDDTTLPEDFTLEDAAKSFSGEFKKQASDIAEKAGGGFKLLTVTASIIGIAVGLTQLAKLFPSKK